MKVLYKLSHLMFSGTAFFLKLLQVGMNAPLENFCG